MKVSKFRREALSRKKRNEGIFTINKKPRQFQMIKSNKEITVKTRETFFLYRTPQKLKIARNVFRKTYQETHREISLFSVSRIVPKKRKVASYRRKNELGVFFRNGFSRTKVFFQTSFHSALAILEPPIYVVVEQFGWENISLLSVGLVQNVFQIS